MEHLNKVDIPVILCINKIDKLESVDKMFPFLESLSEKFSATEVFPLSAFERKDTQKLRKLIFKIPSRTGCDL